MKYMYKFIYVHSHICMLTSFVLKNEVVYLNTNKFIVESKCVRMYFSFTKTFIA